MRRSNLAAINAELNALDWDPPLRNFRGATGESLVRIGEMLRLYRAAKRFTTRELAAQVGISHPTLNRIERGEAADVASVMKLLVWMVGQDATA